MGFFRTLWRCRRTVVLIFAPFLLLPVPLSHPNQAGKCAYAMLLMATYWVTEALPIAVTALLPIVLMPWLGVASSKQMCANYLKDTNMLFMGGLVVAVAVEKWNLHKRIALRVLLLVGSKPAWLMFGFMSTTAFLSMWLSNTATTAMMIPIAHAVLSELERQMFTQVDEVDNTSTTVDTNIGNSMEIRENPAVNEDTASTKQQHANSSDMNFAVCRVIEKSTAQRAQAEKFKSMSDGIALCVAYAANIGGTATLTGTGPNLVFKGQLDTIFGSVTGINFSSWFIFAFPNMVLALLAAWLWLQLMFLGPREFINCFRGKRNDFDDNKANEVLRKEYDKLGPLSFAEKAVLGHFICLALLWITRNPEVVPGWASIPLLEPGFVTDGCVAITVGVVLFMFPSRRPNYLCFRCKTDLGDPGPSPALLDWQTVHEKMSWNVVFVLGGGFALADACKTSGFSSAIGSALMKFEGFPPWGLDFILCTATALFTEITSNVSTATILLPILAELSVAMRIHPLYLMIPVTISCSFAFMLPVATPPNAIVFAYSRMTIFDMVRVGAVMNVVCLLILQLAINTWGLAYFKLNHLPSWAISPDAMTTVFPSFNASSEQTTLT